MTDNEWAVFRSHYLGQHNVYLPDDQRPLYDGPMGPPDVPGRATPESTPLVSLGAPASEVEGHGASEAQVATRPQLEIDLTKFMGGR
jgi:hypothetical protein